MDFVVALKFDTNNVVLHCQPWVSGQWFLLAQNYIVPSALSLDFLAWLVYIFVPVFSVKTDTLLNFAPFFPVTVSMYGHVQCMFHLKIKCSTRSTLIVWRTISRLCCGMFLDEEKHFNRTNNSWTPESIFRRLAYFSCQSHLNPLRREHLSAWQTLVERTTSSLRLALPNEERPEQSQQLTRSLKHRDRSLDSLRSLLAPARSDAIKLKVVKSVEDEVSLRFAAFSFIPFLFLRSRPSLFQIFIFSFLSVDLLIKLYLSPDLIAAVSCCRESADVIAIPRKFSDAAPQSKQN